MSLFIFTAFKNKLLPEPNSQCHVLLMCSNTSYNTYISVYICIKKMIIFDPHSDLLLAANKEKLVIVV